MEVIVKVSQADLAEMGVTEKQLEESVRNELDVAIKVTDAA